MKAFRTPLVILTVAAIVLLSAVPVGVSMAQQEDEWNRIATDGINNPSNRVVWPAKVYLGRLYFAIPPLDPDATTVPIWTYGRDGFKKAAPDGFGDPNNVSCLPLAFHDGHIYCGTRNEVEGGELFRSNDGETWKQVGQSGFGNPDNELCVPLGIQNERLLVGFDNPEQGIMVYAYDGNKWTAASTPGLGDPSRDSLSAGAVVDGRVHVIANSDNDKVFPMAYQGGTSWKQTGPVDFGNPNNSLSHFVYSNGQKMYVGVDNYVDGGEVWCYDGSDWSRIGENGLGDPDNTVVCPYEWGGTVYVSTCKAKESGPFEAGDIYRQERTGDFEPWVKDGFGDGGNVGLFMNAEYGGRFIVGTMNPNGFQVWSRDALSSAMPKTYYFAEGTTRDNPVDGTFQEWVSIENPSEASAANVNVSYMLEDASVINRQYSVNPSSRLTVDVQYDVGIDRDVSVKVTSDQPILAERPMYFDYRGKWTGGHVVMGVPEPSKLFYFAEGTTRDNPVDGTFEEWICIQNPNKDEAQVRLTYMLGTGETRQADYTVAGTSRKTVDVFLDAGKDQDVSVLLESDLPVVAERPMYFDYHGMWPGGHVTSGALGPETELYFAEGCTHSWAQEWLCIQNPGDEAANVTLRYQVSGEDEVTQVVRVGPTTRHTVDVAAALGPGKDASIALTSDQPVMAERPMYFNYQEKWPGGHDVIGASATTGTVYFAEGTTRYNPVDGYFDEWLCVQNPGDEAAQVTVTFMKTNGDEVGHSITIEPNSRHTLNVNAILGPEVDSAIKINSDMPIVAERPMYFDYHGFATGGHDAIGYGID